MSFKGGTVDSIFFDDPAYGPLVRAFETAFEVLPLPAILFTHSGTCLASNAGYAHLLAEGRLASGQSLVTAIAERDALSDALRAARERKSAKASLACTFPDAPAALRQQLLQFFSFDAGENVAGLVAHVIPIGDAEAALSSAEPSAQPSMRAARIALWNTCPATGETQFSDEFYWQLGYEPGAFEPSLSHWVDLINPDDRGLAVSGLNHLLAGGADHYEGDFRMRHADGSWQWVGLTGALLDRSSQGVPDLICYTQTDITRRKIAEAQIAEAAAVASEHRMRLDRLADNTPVGLFEFRIDAEGKNAMPYVSESALQTLGVSRNEVDEDGTNVFRNIVPDYLPQMSDEIAASMRDLTEFKMRYELDHPQNGRRWVTVNSVPERRSDGATTWFGALYDITEDMAREVVLQEARDHAIEMTARMEILAMQDALTGLDNRRKLESDLELRRARNCGPDMTLVRVDLDHFKYVNDNLGHDAGDAVLVHVAAILRDSTAPDDIIYRIGGDEFSILLGPNGTEQDAHEIVAKIQTALAAPFLFEGQVCRFGASFGIASRTSDSISDYELNTFADVALYEAKARGRNRVEVFTAELHRHLIDNRRLAAELEDALERSEFVPYFQPQVCAADGTLVGLETLARWEHPTRGVLSPIAFMKVAEQIRMVPLLDRMILDKTRHVLRDWRDRGVNPPKVNFNVSSAQLQERQIVDMARSFLDDGFTIAFELLESILLEEETEIFRHNLDALKDMGVQIEIDDFGSGHASVVGLMHTDPAVLKIDQQLVAPLEASAQSQHLVTAIIEMARALGIRTTAEGVETSEQAELLRRMGCNVLQGYLISRPLDAEACFSFAQSHLNSAA